MITLIVMKKILILFFLISSLQLIGKVTSVKNIQLTIPEGWSESGSITGAQLVLKSKETYPIQGRKVPYVFQVRVVPGSGKTIKELSKEFDATMRQSVAMLNQQLKKQFKHFEEEGNKLPDLNELNKYVIREILIDGKDGIEVFTETAIFNGDRILKLTNRSHVLLLHGEIYNITTSFDLDAPKSVKDASIEFLKSIKTKE